MSDSFTETSHEGWLSRLGGSIKAMLMGLILFVVSFPLLFWNEGRAVQTAKSLNEGQAATVHVEAAAVDAQNEGKLVHVNGRAVTDDTLRDQDFGIQQEGVIRLARSVEMYQWDERKSTKNKKKYGGGEKRETTYSYEKKWSSSAIDSGRFKRSTGHENPGNIEIPSKNHTASRVTLGAFVLPADLVGDIRGGTPVAVSEANIPERYADRMTVSGGELYLGANPSAPQIGDIKVRFTITEPADVTVGAQQSGETFRPYQTEAGDAISILEMGNLSVEEMFARARHRNSMWTWGLRGAGCFLMFLGFQIMLKPLSILGDVIPIVGSIIGGGSAIVSFLVMVVGASTTIAIAWLFYRPLLGGALLAIAAIGVFFLFFRRSAASEPKVGPVMTLDESDVMH